MLISEHSTPKHLALIFVVRKTKHFFLATNDLLDAKSDESFRYRITVCKSGKVTFKVTFVKDYKNMEISSSLRLENH